MSDTIFAKFREYGLLPAAGGVIGAWLALISIWAMVHFIAEPDQRVSVFWGMVEYTKALTGKEKRLAEANRRLREATTKIADLERKLHDSDRSLGETLTCVEGPVYSGGHVSLRVSPVIPECWFVAVSQDNPGSVWVQRLDRQDPEGRLRLQAYEFEGRYGIYAACDEATTIRLQALQAKAANGKSATLHDMPRGALPLCMNDAR